MEFWSVWPDHAEQFHPPFIKSWFLLSWTPNVIFFLTLLLLWGLIFASPDWFLLLIFFLIDFCFCSLISGFAGLFVFWLIFVSAGWFLLLLINFLFPDWFLISVSSPGVSHAGRSHPPCISHGWLHQLCPLWDKIPAQK